MGKGNKIRIIILAIIVAALAGVFLWQFFSHPSKKINPVIDRSARIEGAPSEYPYLTSDYLNARYSDYYENHGMVRSIGSIVLTCFIGVVGIGGVIFSFVMKKKQDGGYTRKTLIGHGIAALIVIAACVSYVAVFREKASIPNAKEAQCSLYEVEITDKKEIIIPSTFEYSSASTSEYVITCKIQSGMTYSLTIDGSLYDSLEINGKYYLACADDGELFECYSVYRI